MSMIEPRTGRSSALEEVRIAMGELFGAERRLRARDHQPPGGLTQSQLRALILLDKEETVTAGQLAKSAGPQPGHRDRHARSSRIQRHRGTKASCHRPPGLHGVADRQGAGHRG